MAAANATYELVENWNTTNITKPSQPVEQLGDAEIAVIGLVFSSIFASGTVGNVLVVITLLLNPKMRRQVSNVFLLNLAVADLLFLWLCVPVTIGMYASGYWTHGLITCKIWKFSMHASSFGSAYTMVLLSLDRFAAVVVPIRSRRWRTPLNACILVFAMWTGIVVGSAKLLWEYELRLHVNGKPICVHTTKNKANFHLIFLLVQYLLPFLAIVILYSLLLHKLRKGAEKKKAKKPTLLTPENEKPLGIMVIDRNTKVTLLVVGVVIAFAVCWFPLQLRLLLHMVGREIPFWFQLLGQAMVYMNSMLNPVLYAFLSDNFRQGFAAILKCQLRLYLQRIRDMIEEEVLEAVENSKLAARQISVAITGEATNAEQPEQREQDKAKQDEDKEPVQTNSSKQFLNVNR